MNRQHTFINDIDFIQQLRKYAADGYLISTTKFITTDIEKLYTVIPRDAALAALDRFCIKYSQQGKIGSWTIDHIMKIDRLILNANCSAYQNRYYKQIHGGAMGSAFTQVLANIYMLEWEQDLKEDQRKHHEIYGRYVNYQFSNTHQDVHNVYHSCRYIDDICMKTNKTIDAINIKLDKAKK